MKRKHEQTFSFILVIVSLAVLLTIFLNSYSSKDQEMVFKGYEIAFGKQVVDLTIGSFNLSSASIKFNFIVTLSYVLPLLSFILLIVAKRNYLIPSLLLIAAGILFIYAPQTAVIEWNVPIIGTETASLELIREIGNWLGLGLSFIGGILGLYINFNKK